MPVTVLHLVCDHPEVTSKIKSWVLGVDIQFRTERTIILLVLDIEFLWLIGRSVDGAMSQALSSLVQITATH